MLAGPGNCLPPDDDPSSMHPESEPSRPARRRSILLVFMTLAVGLGVIGLWGFGGSGSEGTSGGGLVVRNVTIDEVGNVAAFYFSELSSAITGEITYVDCGFSTVAGAADE